MEEYTTANSSDFSPDTHSRLSLGFWICCRSRGNIRVLYDDFGESEAILGVMIVSEAMPWR
jgi:hypothetical protein